MSETGGVKHAGAWWPAHPLSVWEGLHDRRVVIAQAATVSLAQQPRCMTLARERAGEQQRKET